MPPNYARDEDLLTKFKWAETFLSKYVCKSLISDVFRQTVKISLFFFRLTPTVAPQVLAPVHMPPYAPAYSTANYWHPNASSSSLHSNSTGSHCRRRPEQTCLQLEEHSYGRTGSTPLGLTPRPQLKKPNSKTPLWFPVAEETLYNSFTTWIDQSYGLGGGVEISARWSLHSSTHASRSPSTDAEWSIS